MPVDLDTWGVGQMSATTGLGSTLFLVIGSIQEGDLSVVSVLVLVLVAGAYLTCGIGF